MAKEDNTQFVNPLKEGVSYNDFIKALGTKTVKNIYLMVKRRWI